MISGCNLPATKSPRRGELETRDFFRTRAQTPLSEIFLMTGSTCRISTNCDVILACARKLFASLPANAGKPALEFRFWIDHDPGGSSPPWPKPYFRGLGRFVFAGFDGLNSLLVDLTERRVVGRFTRTFAEDQAMWKKIVFPIIPAVLASSIPVSILHCACVEIEGKGLLLAGPSGSGKSTLTLALARQGFGYLADDRTYLSRRNGRLFAWSVGGFLKLRSDAGRHFLEPGVKEAGNGENILELDPEDDLGFTRVKCCEPHCLVFLERGTGSSPEVRKVEPAEALARLEQDLTSESNDLEFRREVIHGLAQMPCFALRNQGSLEVISKKLTELLSDWGRSTRPQNPPRHPRSVPVQASKGDPLRRMAPLNYILPISVMGKAGSLETNSSSVLESARALFRQTGTSNDSPSRFTWRIVSEADASMSPPWPSLAAFSSGELRFVNMGQRSFVAIHLGTTQAVGFVSENLAKDGPGFAAIFLSTLFYLTAPSLGFTPLKAACVSRGDKGLLLLGPPRSGKTSCAYAGTKLGLEFHSDMVTFLELEDGKLHAWGEFWPALFREEATRFLPELRYLGQSLEHESETFLTVDKDHLCRRPPRFVELALAVVLDRGSTDIPRIGRLPAQEYSEVLQSSLPYAEEGSYKSHQVHVLTKLARIPAYKLTYGNDPAGAAMLCRSLLAAQDILKAVP